MFTCCDHAARCERPPPPHYAQTKLKHGLDPSLTRGRRRDGHGRGRRHGGRRRGGQRPPHEGVAVCKEVGGQHAHGARQVGQVLAKLGGAGRIQLHTAGQVGRASGSGGQGGVKEGSSAQACSAPWGC